jgi:putative ABC transport system ATP-binding protein
MSKNAIIKCENITKNFKVKKREIQILKGINLSVNKGEIIVITGKSGTGKSTLLNILGGLESQTSGSVIFNQQIMENMSNDELSDLRRKNIGIIFQNFNLIPTWTAIENVESAVMHIGLNKSARIQKAISLLNEFGLEDRLDNLPAELSIGQQQRVAIARAFMNDPTLILADEPTGDVDPETAQVIIESLITPVKQRSVTLIVATHGVFPFDIANRVFFIENGSLIPKI